MSETSTWRNQRTLAVITILLLLALAGGGGILWVRGAQRQRDAAEALRGGLVIYGYQLDENLRLIDADPSGGVWLRDWLGNDFLSTARSVTLWDADEANTAALEDLRGLYALHIYKSDRFKDPQIEHLRPLAQLQELSFGDAGISDAGLATLAEHTRLRRLTLLDCKNVTDAGCDAISNIAGLREAAFVYNPRITNAGIGELNRLPALEKLYIDFHGQVTDAVLQQLAEAPRLRNITLSYDNRPAGDGLKYLGGLASLKSLVLIGQTGLTDEAFGSLEAPGLEELYLFACPDLTSDGLKTLQRLPNLRRLALELVPWVDNAVIARLESLPELTDLILVGDPGQQSLLIDTALESIGRLSHLRTLQLSFHKNLTDAGLAHLAGLTNLERLQIEVENLNQFSSAAIGDLRRRLPACQIECLQTRPKQCRFEPMQLDWPLAEGRSPTASP